MERINAILQNNIGLFAFILIGLLGLVLIFLILHFARGRKAQAETLQSLLKAQERLLGETSATLANQLRTFASRELVETVQGGYERMISKDLLPSVNAAAAVVSELSSAVVNRQESGMQELADNLAALFTARTEQYLAQEAKVVASMNEAAERFSGHILQINQTAVQLSEQYSDVYNKAHAISETLSSAVTSLGGHLSGLETTLEKNAHFAESMHGCILESGEVVKSITQSVEQMQQVSAQAVDSVSVQQEATALLLRDAVSAMQQNTDEAAKAVLREFGSALSANNGALAETIVALHEIVAGLQNTADRFSTGVADAYSRFGDAVDVKTEQLSNAFAESAGQEYQRLLTSAETYATGFSRDISSLSEALESHLANLHTVTHQLSNTVDAFKNDADASTHRFESGIEQLVSSALKEMDKSLADIVGRLVSVAASIGEAADALPRAVCSIRDVNTQSK